jgi:WD40 repeat protein
MVRIWDAQGGALVRSLRGHEGEVKSVAFSPDSRRLASAGGFQDHTVRLWDVESGADPGRLRGHMQDIRHIAFSPDGSLVLTGGDGLILWDAASGLEAGRLGGPDFRPTDAAFSPDGQRIVCGTDDRSVQVWSVSRRGLLLRLEASEAPVVKVAFSPDSREILAGLELKEKDETLTGEINFIFVWDAASGMRRGMSEGSEEVFKARSWQPGISSGGRYLFSLRAGTETVVELAGKDSGLRLPLAFEIWAHHPEAKIWAGVVNTELYLYRLEEGKV